MILVINFKTYPAATGEKAVGLAKICKEVSEKANAELFVAVQPTDIAMMKDLPVVSQHVDHYEQGRYTGFILPEAIKSAGAVGSLINHSEHRISIEDIEKSVKRCKDLGLKTIVCAATTEEGKQIAKFDPDYLAFEDPALISTGISISKTKPDSVKEFVEEVKKVNPNVIPLCGAGISTGEDVKASIELGCAGVLAASAITKAQDPRKVLEDFVGI